MNDMNLESSQEKMLNHEEKDSTDEFDPVKIVKEGWEYSVIKDSVDIGTVIGVIENKYLTQEQKYRLDNIDKIVAKFREEIKQKNEREIKEESTLEMIEEDHKIVEDTSGRFFDEIEYEDLQYDEKHQQYIYPCPCGDQFQITYHDLHENKKTIARCPSCSLYIIIIR